MQFGVLLTGNESATSFTVAFKLWVPKGGAAFSGITFTTVTINDPLTNFNYVSGKKFMISFYDYWIYIDVYPNSYYSGPNPCTFGAWCHLAYVHNLTINKVQIFMDGVFLSNLETGPLNFYSSDPTYTSAFSVYLCYAHRIYRYSYIGTVETAFDRPSGILMSWLMISNAC